MECDKVEELLWEYRAQSLPEELMGSVTNHLNHCTSCHEVLEGFQRVDLELDRLDEIAPSPYFTQRLNARLDEQERPQPSFFDLSYWLKDRYAWSFLILLVAAVSLWMTFRYQQAKNLHNLDDVVQVQDEFLGRKGSSPEGPTAMAVQSKPEAVGGDGLENLTEEDLAVVENIDLLENYEFLEQFELADQLLTPALN